MSKSGLLGGLEEMVLLAVCHIGENAYAVPVRTLLEERLGRSMSMGAVYGTLDRLESKELAASRLGDATTERQGRPRRYFTVLPEGLEALRRSSELRARMWDGIGTKVLPTLEG